MSGPRSAMVFFSHGASNEAFADEAVRQQTLAHGVDAILANVAGLQVTQANDFSCTVSVMGNPESILRLKDFVAEAALGAVELEVFEKPAFRAG
jgi:hypothetical protein